MEKVFLFIIILSGLPISFFSFRLMIDRIAIFLILIKRGFNESDINKCSCASCMEDYNNATQDQITIDKKEAFDTVKNEMRDEMLEQIYYSVFYSSATGLAIIYFLS